MAAAFFNKLAHAKKAQAISAGTEPASRIHSEVLAVMNETDIDLSQAKPTLLTIELIQNANLLVTMGCGEKCPYVPGLEMQDWNIDDPKGRGSDEVRYIRDQIRTLVLELIKKNGWA